MLLDIKKQRPEEGSGWGKKKKKKKKKKSPVHIRRFKKEQTKNLVI